jgi:hypothetical protein
MEHCAPTTYGVQKTNLAVHTEDRDITKWIHPNHFEIELPVAYKNVTALRLNEIGLPTVTVFSEVNQNTKLTVEISATPYYIDITPGNYTPDELAAELSGQISADTGVTFVVVYNKVSNIFIFTCLSHSFTLRFDKPEQYPRCGNPSYFENYTNWGLGSYLGFDKVSTNKLHPTTGLYDSVFGEVDLYWRGDTPLNTHYVAAPKAANVDGDSHIYLELATHNSMDEIQPYQERSSDTAAAKYGGQHNASFARIPVRPLSSAQDYLFNIFFSIPPLERIQKFRFRFRHHDGRLVDFHFKNFSFSIEITFLRNETPNTFLMNKTNYKLS